MNVFLGHTETAVITSERAGLFIQILCLLTLIIVGSYLCTHIKGRILRAKQGIKTQKKLEILETKVLGNRQFLCVVAYENQHILLGVSPNNLQFLCSLDAKKIQNNLDKNL